MRSLMLWSLINQLFHNSTCCIHYMAGDFSPSATQAIVDEDICILWIYFTSRPTPSFLSPLPYMFLTESLTFVFSFLDSCDSCGLTWVKGANVCILTRWSVRFSISSAVYINVWVKSQRREINICVNLPNNSSGSYLIIISTSEKTEL